MYGGPIPRARLQAKGACRQVFLSELVRELSVCGVQFWIQRTNERLATEKQLMVFWCDQVSGQLIDGAGAEMLDVPVAFSLVKHDPARLAAKHAASIAVVQ